MNPWQFLNFIPGGQVASFAGQVLDPNVDLVPGVTVSNRKGQKDVNPFNNPTKAKTTKTSTPLTGATPSADEGQFFSSGAGGGYDPAAAEEAQRISRIQGIRDEVKGRRMSVEQAYQLLFQDIDNLAKERAAAIEKTAGDNTNKLTEQYTQAIPGIESSYAAIGAGDSTDTRDAKNTARSGYESGIKEVGKVKSDDLAKVGNYVQGQKADWNADKDSIFRMIDRVDQTEDEGDLNSVRNTIDDKISTAGANRAKLGTDEGARGALSGITNDAGRFDSIKGAFDNILNSSLSGGVKQAAFQAVMNSSDLNDDEKKQFDLQYGKVYGEQQAL